MKKVIMPFAFAAAVVGFVSCSGSSTETTTTDSISASSSTSETSGATTSEVTTAPEMKESYTELSTGEKVSIEKDASTGFYINKSTRKPVDFYYDAETHDTFDTRGRVVNMAITKGANGSYMVDESRIKVQSDGDLKITNDATDTKVKLETNGDTKVKTDDYKEKTRGDDYKYKDDSTKIKVKDGKLTIKKKD